MMGSYQIIKLIEKILVKSKIEKWINKYPKSAFILFFTLIIILGGTIDISIASFYFKHYYTYAAFDELPLATYTGHTDAITCLQWSPDGKFIASGSTDGTIQINSLL